MENKEISVIMGVYNDEKYLSKAIKSVLEQSYCNFEFIICNDCSIDKSEEIIKKFQEKDDRIIYLKNKQNLGLATTLNKCIDNASGKYIARMDSDDISLPNRLQAQHDFLEKHLEFDVVGTLAYFIDEYDKAYKKFNRMENVELKDGVKKSQIIHPTAMIRKSALLNVNKYSVNKNTQRAEDYDLWCKILEKGGKIKNLQEYHFLYRESIQGLKKRKFQYRLQEAKIKAYWIKRTNQPVYFYIYSIKPIIVGLIPAKLMNFIRGGKKNGLFEKNDI